MKKVLIVDDDKDLLEMVCMMVSRNHMHTVGVDTADAAWAALEHDQVDLILMDIFLGETDGRQLSKTIKNDSRFHQVPILLYSAHDNITSESLEEAEANGFVKKPFEMSVLIKRMNELMSVAS